MMRHRALALVAAAAALSVTLLAAGAPVVVSGQLLAYQDGYVFFTTGDGFHVAPNVVLRDARTNGAATIQPAPRIWARATFDATGTVTELDLSRTPLPPEGSFAEVSRFAVALSTPYPDPDLVPYVPSPGASIPPNVHFNGKPVLVTFIVEVPPNTPFTASVYMTTDQSGWNPQAVPMDRVDALHYKITERLKSGTIFHYFYTRGSFQTEEVSQNGLQRKPREIVVTNSDVRVVNDKVFAWLDSLAGTQQQAPTNALPTPYNPLPFPNVPVGAPTPNNGVPTPHAPGKPPQR
jgi:hypothetical protein